MSPEQIVEIGGVLFLVAIAIVALTPTTKDDEALKGFLASLSPTRKAVGGASVAVVLALLAALLGGCASLPVPSPDDVRAVACKACAAIGGAKGEACAAALGCP